MKKNEQDILNIVKEKMENVDVPESIMPEQIENRMVVDSQWEDAVSHREHS